MATSTELKQSIAAGQYDAAFEKLYAKDAAVVAAQRERYIHAIERFEHYYGTGRTVRIYSAPGRTEIGGNHTDHNNGVVMAGAVNLDVVSVVSPTEGTLVRLKSHGFDKMDHVDLSVLTPQPDEKEHSAALIRGVAAGIVICCAVILIRFLVNDTFVTADDLARRFGIQPLASIPEADLGAFNKRLKQKK